MRLATRPRQDEAGVVSRTLALCVFLTACAHAAAPPIVDAAPVVVRESVPTAVPDELVLERTPCSGSCPVYALTVHRDGHVHFTGVRDVALVGEREWRIDATFARHLISEVERAGLFTFAPRYATEVEEFPGLVLSLRRAGRSGRVQLGGEGSVESPRDLDVERVLKGLAKTIDTLTGAGRFIEKDSKKQGGACTD